MWSHCWFWGPGFFFGGPWMMIIGLIFWAFVIYLVYYIISSLVKRGKQDRERDEDALEILKRRFARGEIDEKEFEGMRKLLESNVKR